MALLTDSFAYYMLAVPYQESSGKIAHEPRSAASNTLGSCSHTLVTVPMLLKTFKLLRLQDNYALSKTLICYRETRRSPATR